MSIPFADVLRQWPLLPLELRKRKADELAERLAGARRATQAVVEAPNEIDPTARNGPCSPSAGCSRCCS